MIFSQIELKSQRVVISKLIASELRAQLSRQNHDLCDLNDCHDFLNHPLNVTINHLLSFC